MKTQTLLRFAAALTACLLTGCGGGGGGSQPTAAQKGSVRFQIQWPTAAAQSHGKAGPSLIPLDAKSIVITISDGGKVISGPTVIAAPAAGATATTTVPNLPLKALTALIEAKADAAGNGAAETAASEAITPTAGTPATAPTLVLLSQITKLTIATTNVSLFVNGSINLSATPLNAQGQVVMVDPNTKAIQWTLGASLTLAPGTVSTGLTIQVVGTTAGASSVSATYSDGSAATGDAVSVASNGGVPVQIVVQNLPSGRPPNVPQYIDANLAIGPNATGPGNFQSLQDIALGSLYTADLGNNTFEVQKYLKDTTTGALTLDPTFNAPGSANGTAGTISLAGANVVAVDPNDDSAYVSNQQSVYKLAPTQTQAQTDASLSIPFASVSGVTGLAVDARQNVYILSRSGVQVFSGGGAFLASFAPAALNATAGVAVDKAYNVYALVMVTSPSPSGLARGFQILKLKPQDAANPPSQGNPLVADTTFGPNKDGFSANMGTPLHLAVDTRPGLPTAGNIYVTLPDNNQVEVFVSSGSDAGPLPLSGITLSTPTGITIDTTVGTPTSGYIYIGNATFTGTIQKAVQVFKPQ